MKNKKMRQTSFDSESGAILLVVIILALALTITGLAFLSAGVMENSLVRREIHKNQAFYLAEAGIERLGVRLYAGEHRSIKDTPSASGGHAGSYQPALVGETGPATSETPINLGEGDYWVEYYYRDPPQRPYAISIGRIIKGGQEIVKKIQVELPFLAAPYEYGIYAASRYSPDWTLELRGTDNPQRRREGTVLYEYRLNDTVEGDIYANADVHLYEEATVSSVPNADVLFPNTDKFRGIVNSTNSSPSVWLHSSESFAPVIGGKNEGVEEILPPDLLGANYATNNDYNVAGIFSTIGTGEGGRLADSDHDLYNVVRENPGYEWFPWYQGGPFDRRPACDSTEGDDYFFEPASGFILGNSDTALTPLNLGQDKVYYVDGDVWFFSQPTYGFEMSGRATIVATGDIHISDNIKYADPENDMLALIALGKYDDAYDPPKLTSGGNIYFGDAEWGNTYEVDAFMLAGSNFLYNVGSSAYEKYKRPNTGFTIVGNWVALGEVSVMRDWYKTGNGDWNPAYFDRDVEKWFYFNPNVTGAEYDPTERGGLGWECFAEFDPTIDYTDPETGEVGKWKYLQGEEWKDLPGDQTLENLNETLKGLDLFRHYQMKIEYDDRILNPENQPPGLPEGYGGSIFAGFTDWEEIQ